MSYNPTEWTSGDVITAEKLNKIELGIANELPHTTELLFEGDLIWDEELGGYVIPIQFEDRIPLVLEAEFSWHGKPINAGYDVGNSWCYHQLYFNTDSLTPWSNNDLRIRYGITAEETKIFYVDEPANNKNGVHLILKGNFYPDLETPFEDGEYGWCVHLPNNNIFYYPGSDGTSIMHRCAFIVGTEIPDDTTKMGICMAQTYEGSVYYSRSFDVYSGNLINIG